MSDFGPPPGAGPPPAPRRPPSYLPPGGFAGPASASRRYASHKPGIIALRPLSAGDLLDGATALVRRNPGTVLALSAVVNAAAVLLALLLLAAVVHGGWLRRSGADAVVDGDTLPALLLLGAPLAATALLAGLLGPPAGAAILGGRPPLPEAWAAARPVLPALLGAAAVTVGAFVAPWVLAVGAVVLVASTPPPVVLAVGTAAVLGAAAATLAVVPRVALAAPAAALERRGARDALRRAVALSRRRYWSLLGVGLLTVGVGVLLFVGLQLLSFVAGTLVLELLELEESALFAGAVSVLVAATVVTPFLAGALVLQYVDARMRAEGHDLVLRGPAPAWERR